MSKTFFATLGMSFLIVAASLTNGVKADDCLTVDEWKPSMAAQGIGYFDSRQMVDGTGTVAVFGPVGHNPPMFWLFPFDNDGCARTDLKPTLVTEEEYSSATGIYLASE